MPPFWVFVLTTLSTSLSTTLSISVDFNESWTGCRNDFLSPTDGRLHEFRAAMTMAEYNSQSHERILLTTIPNYSMLDAGDFWRHIYALLHVNKYRHALEALDVRLPAGEMEKDEEELFQLLFATFWIAISFEGDSTISDPDINMAIENAQRRMAPLVQKSSLRRATLHCLGLLESEGKARANSCEIASYSITKRKKRGKSIKIKRTKDSKRRFTSGLAMFQTGRNTLEDLRAGLRRTEGKRGACTELEDSVELGCLDARWALSFCRRLIASASRRATLLRTVEGVAPQHVPQSIQRVPYDPLESMQVLIHTIDPLWRDSAYSGVPLILCPKSTAEREILNLEAATITWISTACASAVADEVLEQRPGEHNSSIQTHEAILVAILSRAQGINTGQTVARARWDMSAACPRALEVLLRLNESTSAKTLGDLGSLLNPEGVWRVPPVSANAFSIFSPNLRIPASLGGVSVTPESLLGVPTIALSAPYSRHGSGAWQLWFQDEDNLGPGLQVGALSAHFTATLLAGSLDAVVFSASESEDLLGFDPIDTSYIIPRLSDDDTDGDFESEGRGDAPLAIRLALKAFTPNLDDHLLETQEDQKKIDGTEVNLDGWATRRLKGTKPWRFKLVAGETLVVPAGCAYALRARSSEKAGLRGALFMARQFLDSSAVERTVRDAVLVLANPDRLEMNKAEGVEAGGVGSRGSPPPSLQRLVEIEATAIASTLPSLAASATNLPCCRVPFSNTTVTNSTLLLFQAACPWTTVFNSTMNHLFASCVTGNQSKNSGEEWSPMTQPEPFLVWPSAVPALAVLDTPESDKNMNHIARNVQQKLVEDCLIVEDVAKGMATTKAGATDTNHGEGDGGTFFLPAGATPRHSLERLAAQVYDFHMGHLVNRSRHGYGTEGGSEWWIQLATDATDPRELVGFHFDRDMLLWSSGGERRHPFISTVTYLTNGAVTQLKRSNSNGNHGIFTTENCISGAPTMVLELNYSAASNIGRTDARNKKTKGKERVWLSWPRAGQHTAFGGTLLHGAPHQLRRLIDPRKCSSTSEKNRGKTMPLLTLHSIQNPPLSSIEPPKNVILGQRAVLVVNIWRDAAPWGVPSFPAAAVPLLSDMALDFKPKSEKYTGEGPWIVPVDADSERIALHGSGEKKSQGTISVSLPYGLLNDENETRGSFVEMHFEDGIGIEIGFDS